MTKDEWEIATFEPKTLRNKLVVTLGWILYKLRMISARDLSDLKMNLAFVEIARKHGYRCKQVD